MLGVLVVVGIDAGPPVPGTVTNVVGRVGVLSGADSRPQGTVSDSHGIEGELLAWMVTNVVGRSSVVGEVGNGPLPGADAKLIVTVSTTVPSRGTVVMRTPGLVIAGLGDCCPAGLGDCSPVGFEVWPPEGFCGCPTVGLGGCCPPVFDGCWP